jgi:two-component system OmpR family sensor kinase
MIRAASLQTRLAIGIGLTVTVLWIVAASVTAEILRREVNEVFDSALEETAQRILPLAAVEILGREEEGVALRLATIRGHMEYFTYVVRDTQGRVLFQSHDADLAAFPPYAGPGFHQTAAFRYYEDSVLSGSLTITVAEPMAHRREVLRNMQIVLGLPLIAVIPLSLIGIGLAVRGSLGPLRRLRDALAMRGAGDLSPIGEGQRLPAEIAPFVSALNSLLARLEATFEAERSFAANAAHELRTPLAGAIAQVQRLQSETSDKSAAQRGSDIEKTLKRLTHLSERLMQLARAEGGRLRADHPADLRPVLRLIADDVFHGAREHQISLSLPDAAVMSDIDSDAFGILCRNLIENASRHGAPDGAIEVTLTSDGVLSVVNEGPVIAPEALARLTERFERIGTSGEGSGLGLAIVRAIAERAGGKFALHSPARGRESGFEARLVLPLYGQPDAGSSRNLSS